MAWDGRIPYLFDAPVPFTWGHKDYEWRDNEPFEAKLTFKGFHRGRSAANAVYYKDDDESWEATMFLSELSKLIEQGYAPLHLHGRFEFVKRGTNFGIILIDVI